MKKSTRKTIVMLVIAFVIVALTVAMVAILIKTGKSSHRAAVHDLLVVEAGSEPDISAFLKDKSLNALLDENSTYNTSRVGEYKLLLHLTDGTEHEVTLRVVDTVAPVVKELQPLLLKKGSLPGAGSILTPEFIIDETPVRVNFLASRVNTSAEGDSSVTLRVEDEGGNVTKVTVPIHVTEQLNDGYSYEIGTPAPTAEDLLPGCGASFPEGQTLTADVPKTVTARVIVFGGSYFVHYEAKDTTAPTATPVKDARFRVGDPLPDDPSALLAEIIDATAVTVRYKENYTLDQAEQRTVVLLLTDAAGNEGEVEVVISVFDKNDGPDEQPPVFYGIGDLETTQGFAPDYLDGISVYDGRDGEIPVSRVKVDTSAVDLNTPSEGEGYPVVYSVSDNAGNVAKVTVRLKVNRSDLTEDEMNALFDEVMSSIRTSGVSRFTLLSSVYDRVTGQYALTPASANASADDYRTEAYWGFKLKRGNDATYLAMTRVILDRLEIEYIVVDRAKSGREPHSWLLADYGIGWLYIDCAPISGYVWTKTGKLLPADSAEARALTSVEIRKREAMTDKDLAELTVLSNACYAGWNYYTISTSDKSIPPTAERTAQGGYNASQYTVTYTALSGGSLSGRTEQTVRHGNSTTAVTAIPHTGYKFVRWSDGVTTERRTDVVKNNISVSAIFELDNGTLSYYTITYGAEEHGSVRGNASQTLLYGKTTTEVTAIPDAGYYFIEWSDGNKNATRSDLVKSDASYTAVFGQLITFRYAADAHGSIEGPAVQQLIPGKRGVSVTAVPDNGYIFKEWSDGILTATRQDQNDGDLSLTAYFEIDTNYYTYTYRSGTGGFVTGQLQQTLLCGDKTSEVEAMPLPGYVFVSWSDGGESQKRSDIVYANKELTALFRPLAEYTVTYLASEGGRIEGKAVQTVGEGELCESVKAVAEEGYIFCGWDDGKTTVARIDLPTSDMTVTAIFRKDGGDPDTPDPSGGAETPTADPDAP